MKTWLLGLVFFFVFIGACTQRYGTFNDQAQVSKTPESSTDTSAEEPGSNNYYDFTDILIPLEMKLDPDSSLLFETSNIKAGRICFKGWVDPVSVFNFFIKNMSRDNWKLRSYFKYGVYLMVFEKPDRDCIISIHKKTLSTWLEIWVTPRLLESEKAGPE